MEDNLVITKPDTQMISWRSIESIPREQADIIALTSSQRVMILKETVLSQFNVDKFGITHWMFLSDLVHLVKE